MQISDPHTARNPSLVRGVDLFTASHHDDQPGLYHIYADGCVGLAFCDSERDLLFNATKSSKLFLYGQTVKPLAITYSSSFTIEVIYLQPYAIKQLFGIDAHELTDTCIDLDLIDKDLADRLLAINDKEQRLDTALKGLNERQQSVNKEQDKVIAYAIEKMMTASGNISISDLRSEIYLTERTFERRFLQYVGVTPTQYAKICRFYRALQELNSNKFRSLTDVAYSAGYTDQPHFIHHFKEFTSITPSEYLKKLNSN